MARSRLCADCAVCSAIFMSATSFSLFLFPLSLFLLSFLFCAVFSAGTWAHGAWQASTSTSVCTRCLASGAACYLGPRGGSQTARRGRGGRGGRDDRQMQARKFFGYNGKTLRLGTPYKLPRGEGGGVARATGLAAPPLRGTANHWRKLSSLWPNTITEASSLCTCSCVCVCVCGVSACQLQRRLRLRLRHRRRDRGLCEVVKCAKVK